MDGKQGFQVLRSFLLIDDASPITCFSYRLFLPGYQNIWSSQASLLPSRNNSQTIDGMTPLGSLGPVNSSKLRGILVYNCKSSCCIYVDKGERRSTRKGRPKYRLDKCPLHILRIPFSPPAFLLI